MKKPRSQWSIKYEEKLRDPRWKRKRQEILSRDGEICQTCGRFTLRVDEEGEDIGEEDLVLHVHHKWYEWHREPWDYPDEALVTLCESCHDTETDYLEGAEKKLVRLLRTRYNARQIKRLTDGLKYLRLYFGPDKNTAVLAWALTNRAAMEAVTKLYNERNRLRSLEDCLREQLDHYRRRAEEDDR